MRNTTYDVIIVGAGAAGLATALDLPRDCRVAVLAKGQMGDGSTAQAQGGISAVLDDADSIEAHFEDTLIAGGGVCEPAVVDFTVTRGPQTIAWLADLGVLFTRLASGPDTGTSPYHLAREGGHSHRRIIHADDATGRAIADALVGNVRRRANITLLERHIAVDLITAGADARRRCLGIYALDENSGKVVALAGQFVVLATGGASKVYCYTSNPDTATGDGIAMAWRAGCRVANMEFMQFHPTCLYHPGARSRAARSLLISEAVRGEGGRLLLPNGERFMQRFHPDAELAPRDVVARAIDHEMKRLGLAHVYLDISHQRADFIRRHFPTISARCAELGYDMTQEPLPVVPAAHYTCGGVLCDLRGRTDLPRLYAVGETAYTGLHGANRMASNSLLECLVFARAAAGDITTHLKETPAVTALEPWDDSEVTDSDEEVVVSHNWDELRRFMWDYVGIVRTTKRLQRAQRRTRLLQKEIAEYYGNFRITADLLELRNLTQVAELIIHSALERKESRGLHYTLDYPSTDDKRWKRPTVVVPPNLSLPSDKVFWAL